MNLRVNFIWVGSEITKEINFLLVSKILLINSFFIRSGYQIQYTLWVDRPYNAHKIIMGLRRYSYREFDIQIRHVEELFNLVENDDEIREVNLSKRYIRYFFMDKSGCIATCNGSSLSRGIISGSCSPLDKYKYIPAVAADVIKALTGYYYPGLYIDLGLAYNTSRLADFSDIMHFNRIFKTDVYFAATQREIWTFDYQIIYTTFSHECRAVFKRILQNYTDAGLYFSGEPVSHREKEFFYTNRMNNNPVTRGLSDTISIWDPAFKQSRNLYSRQGIKKQHVIPLSVNSCFGSIGYLCYKDRDHSVIADYKKTISDNELLESARAKFARLRL
ncbi:hypothetical protein P0136_10945 [Lentisphaerota bacterium ZTH]|nr:hypothetical protein JYG24_11535 [Lentisphaerota bacterium]WET05878.1 hypothetical protein P0136_10945 [Lentisphaerota bacterium ZTH]